eukprot:COSAG02_NODE_33648_length_496_cov_933.589421_1_plen_103_part_10
MTREAGGFGVSRVVAQPPTPPVCVSSPPRSCARTQPAGPAPAFVFFSRGSAAQSRGLFTSSVVRALDFVRVALPRVGGFSADSRRVSCSSGSFTPDSAQCSSY